MMHGNDLVYASNGTLIKYDEFPNNFTTSIPPDEVVSVDGVQRLVQVFNGTIPGPAIIVYEGQDVVVHVRNRLLSHVLTVHWHGLHQRGTPFMDGVPMVTQCPIAPHQSFTYKFKAYPSGTFWYHSHIAGDRNNGLYGAFIVKEKEEPTSPPPVPEDVVVTVGDWHHADSTEVYMKKTTATYFGLRKYQKTFSFDGAELTPIPWMSGLINGKGRFYDPAKDQEVTSPLSWFTVSSGKAYRFRVIHTGYVFPLRVSIDKHILTVVASDAYKLQQVDCDAFILNPGERFDFILVAQETVSNYWIRTESVEDNVYHHYALAVLNYEGAAQSEKDVTSTVRACTAADPCTVVNCPFLAYPPESHTKCVTFNDLAGDESLPDAPEFVEGRDESVFLNFAYPGYTVFPGAINGRGFVGASSPTLTQPDDDTERKECSDADCGTDKVCWCHHETTVRRDRTVQLVLSSIGSGKSATHPIHVHGYGFHVIKVGYPQYNATTGVMTGQTLDLACDGRFCNAVEWQAGKELTGGRATKSPVKDTLNIPVGGYAVVRFHSDNPGKWLVHCHTAIHVMDGMAMVIDVDAKNANRPPTGFPLCSSFKNDPSQDVPYSRLTSGSGAAQGEPPFRGKYYAVVIVAIILALIAVTLLCVLVYLIMKQRQQRRHNEAVVKFMKVDQDVST